MNVTDSKTLSLQIGSSTKNSSAQNNGVKFSEELESAKKTESSNKQKKGEVDDAINGLNETIDELNKLNQKDEEKEKQLKKNKEDADKMDTNEDSELIDNNMNIQDQQDKFDMQMGANMSFNSNGQQFTEFLNQGNSNDKLSSSSKDLAEENAILSTMEENIAIANKNMAMSKTKIVENEHGIQKFDKKSNIVIDTIVNYDSIIMSKDDVEFFTNLVDNGVLNMNDIKNSQKSSQVSKTLADMLAKAMNDNKPIRIDFDNNISVIIKIDRTGKISADFLPSSQVAEAYLKENLPLLKQKFDDNNLDYNELNQRQRKQDNQEKRKKDNKDE